MNLKKIKIDLPKTWKETSRMGNENQVNIHICHINPIANIDSKKLQDQPMPSSNSNVNIFKVAIPTPNMRPISDFYKGMKGFIESGFAPPSMTMAGLDKLWKGLTETPNAKRPGESDMVSDIDIVQCQDAEFAWQTLKNKANMPTQGFDVPIPGGITAPGLPKNMTMEDYLKSDILKSLVPKKQFEQLQSALKEVKQKIPQVKKDYEKMGIKYREGKYLDCKAIYYESPNLNPAPKPKQKTSSSRNFSGGGGYGNTSIDPLPKITQPYSATNTFYIGIVYKNFIINGSLLSAINSLPSGNTPCYSLTQTEEVTSKTKEGGITFTDVAIIPLVSNYAREGYLCKEDAEEIYRSIISKLK
ncbi:MAG: hypothetical protein PHT51_03735 [Patescibacteria group bacterium]|nr:hypothetical protein [Patescibacteria group bacterium]